jgi:two-component system, sensor histidine kinase ChiS
MPDPTEENQRLREERDLLRRRLAAIEESFLQTVQESQREILAMNDALSAANLRLRELDRLKDAFLSMITHELRTPLTVIVGVAESLETGVYGPLSPEHAEPLRQVSGQAERLMRLVNDLLDLSKMEAGMMRLRREPLDPFSMGEAVVNQLSIVAEKAGVAVHNRIPRDLPEVVCDGRRIEQALANLVVNAIKHSPANSPVTLSAEIDAERIRFSVVDAGRGVPPDAQRRIFDRFFQAPTGDETGATGAGLGLAIVKQIVELHAGEVGVESQAGQGSRFYFSLPLRIEVLQSNPQQFSKKERTL